MTVIICADCGTSAWTCRCAVADNDATGQGPEPTDPHLADCHCLNDYEPGDSLLPYFGGEDPNDAGNPL